MNLQVRGPVQQCLGNAASDCYPVRDAKPEYQNVQSSSAHYMPNLSQGVPNPPLMSRGT